MLIGELPELVETRMGQDILKIGEERGLKIGEERGLVEAAVILLEAKRGRLTKSLRQRLQMLGAKQLRQLLAMPSRGSPSTRWMLGWRRMASEQDGVPPVRDETLGTYANRPAH